MTFSDIHLKLVEKGLAIKTSQENYRDKEAINKYAIVLAYNRFVSKEQMINPAMFLKRCKFSFYNAWTTSDGEFHEDVKDKPISEDQAMEALCSSELIVEGVWEADGAATPTLEPKKEKELTELPDGTDVLRVFLDAFHVNSAQIDDEIAKWVLLSFLGSREITGDGLHLKLTAETGTGKTYSVNAALFTLPQTAFYKGAFTDKALIYDSKLQPGMIIKLDEAQGKSDAFEAILKEAISSYQIGIEYHTVLDKITETKTLAPRLTFILLSADSWGDPQTISRFVPLGLSEKSGKSQLMTDFRLQKREDGVPKLYENEKIAECREILQHFSDREFKVSIPEAKKHIEYKTHDQRLQEWFECAIMYSAVLNYKNRNPKTDDDGVISISATKEDFDFAISFSKFQERGKTEFRFTNSEAELIGVIKKNGFEDKIVDRTDLVKAYGRSDSRLTQIMCGVESKSRKSDGGLMAKLGISEINVSETPVPQDGMTLDENMRAPIKHFNQKAYRIPILPEIDIADGSTVNYVATWKN